MARFRNTWLGGVLYRMPTVVRWVIVLCTVIWILELVPPFHDVLMRGALREDVFSTLRLWQFLTYQFLHALSPTHVLFNMYGLWLFGHELERHWGSARLLRFYLTCGVAAGLAHVLVARLIANPHPVIGASGAIFGVMVAYAMTWPRREMYLLLIPVPIEVRWLVLGYTLLALVFAWNEDNGIANFAHLGGALAGYLYVATARAVYRKRWKLPDLSLAAWRKKRRRSKLGIVEMDKDFDKWLRDMDDSKKH